MKEQVIKNYNLPKKLLSELEIEELKEKYFSIAKQAYPKMERLSAAEYSSLAKKYNSGYKEALNIVMEKSKHEIFKCLASLYALYDIDIDISLSYADGMSEAYLYVRNYIKYDLGKLPATKSVFSRSVINLGTYYSMVRFYNYFIRKNLDKTIKNVTREEIENIEITDDILNKLANDEIIQVLEEFYKTLTDTQIKAFKLKFGLDGNNELTYKEIAKQINMTPQNAHKIVKKVCEKLYNFVQDNELNQILDIN